MNETTAISGTIAGYKTLADGTLRVTVDIDSEAQSRAFHELFPGVHGLVAIVPLKIKEEGEA